MQSGVSNKDFDLLPKISRRPLKSQIFILKRHVNYSGDSGWRGKWNKYRKVD